MVTIVGLGQMTLVTPLCLRICLGLALNIRLALWTCKRSCNPMNSMICLDIRPHLGDMSLSGNALLASFCTNYESTSAQDFKTLS